MSTFYDNSLAVHPNSFPNTFRTWQSMLLLVTNLEESVPLTELLMELTEIKVIEEEEGRSRGTVFLSFEENENWRQFVKGRF